MYKRIIIILFLAISTLVVKGQDIQFSQPYNVALYTNPALAGSRHCERWILNQRVQWPGIGAKYLTTYISYDRFFNNAASGMGFYAINDVQGNLGINTTEVQGIYSYQLDMGKDMTILAGLQLGYVYKQLRSDLIFPHQIDDTGYQFDNDNGLGNSWLTKGSMDVSSGMVWYTTNFYLEASAQHMNRPNRTYFSDFRYPMKVSLSSGYKIHLKDIFVMPYMKNYYERSISPIIHYKFQGKSDQLDMGLYLKYDQLMAGFWYRGIPLKKYSFEFQNNESIVLMGGWRYDGIRINYSYDFVVSTLRPARPWGGHEITISYIPCDTRHKKRMPKWLPCPVPH